MSERILKAIIVLMAAVSCGMSIEAGVWLSAILLGIAAIAGMILIHAELASPVAGTGEKRAERE